MSTQAAWVIVVAMLCVTTLVAIFVVARVAVNEQKGRTSDEPSRH